MDTEITIYMTPPLFIEIFYIKIPATTKDNNLNLSSKKHPDLQVGINRISKNGFSDNVNFAGDHLLYDRFHSCWLL